MEKDKEIADLKDKLSELQQNRQEKEVDFEKRLKTIDEELKKTKENIFIANKTILEKKAEVEKFPKEVQLFNANDCFDLQPSWFDTLLPSNIGCLEINNYHWSEQTILTPRTRMALMTSHSSWSTQRQMKAKCVSYDNYHHLCSCL